MHPTSLPTRIALAICWVTLFCVTPFCVTLCCATEAAAQSYSITGMVTDRTTGSPLPRSHLSASLSSNNRNTRRRSATSMDITVDTDDRGHFVLSVPAPGLWNLFASGRGFRSQELDEHDGFSTGIVLTPASPSIDVVFALTPDSNVAGYVLDEAGEAVRSAQVRLLRESAELADQPRPRWQGAGATNTDDRGHYEFAGLSPGRYTVMVQAQPWYAVGASRVAEGAQQDSASALSLDMAYPLTWHPGVTDPAQADILTLKGGDNGQADVRLQPVPSVHLRIPPPPGSGENRGISIPQIQVLTPSGAVGLQQLRPNFGSHGDVDIGGLAPGTYEISSTGQDHARSILHVGSGSPRVLDLSATVPDTSVTVLFDMPAGATPPQVRFVDAETGRDANARRQSNVRANQLQGDNSLRDGVGRGPGAPRIEGLRTRGPLTVDLAPGRYQVTLADAQGLYMTGLSATGAETGGRFVTVHGGAPVLTLHLASGRATLTGVATLHGNPAAGAMVLLIPATLGDPQSLAIVRRDQANSDGSFDLRDVIPGRYIVLAIDHGWQVNWSDAATLRQYLLHGVPVDLSSAGTHREGVEAQAP